jgi:hypothetical protein
MAIAIATQLPLGQLLRNGLQWQLKNLTAID